MYIVKKKINELKLLEYQFEVRSGFKINYVVDLTVPSYTCLGVQKYRWS